MTGGAKRDGAAATNPEETRKRASGDKVAIQCKYCSNQLDLSKRTFREALHKIKHYVSEMLDQRSLRQLREDPAAGGAEEESDNERDDPLGPGKDGGRHQGRTDHQ